jgi:hypothetical protein
MKHYSYRLSQTEPGCVCVPTVDCQKLAEFLGEPHSYCQVQSDECYHPVSIALKCGFYPGTKLERFDNWANARRLRASLFELYPGASEAQLRALGFSDVFDADGGKGAKA